MAVVEHRLGGHVADAVRHGPVGGVVRGVAQLGHLAGEVDLADPGVAAGREQVGQHLVGREADRLVLVGQGPLGGRAPELAAQAGALGDRVVGGPGVVGGGVEHADGPGGDGRAGGRRVQPDGLKQLLVPLEDDVVGSVVGAIPGVVDRPRRPGGVRVIGRGGLGRADDRETGKGGEQDGRDHHEDGRQLELHQLQPFCGSRESIPHVGFGQVAFGHGKSRLRVGSFGGALFSDPRGLGRTPTSESNGRFPDRQIPSYIREMRLTHKLRQSDQA